MGRILDVNGNVMTTFHREDGKTHIKKTQDVDEVFRLNKIDRNHSTQKGMRKAASIPEVIWQAWHEELRQMGRNQNPLHPDNRMWLLARLNDPAYRKLRTNEDRL